MKPNLKTDPQPTAAAPTASSRLDSLTGLRAVAAFCVFLDHIRYVMAGGPRSALDVVGSQGAMGVTFFFVLSGFVLAWGQKLPVDARHFLWGRLARIYPAYVVALLVGVGVTVYATGAADLAEHLASCLFLVQAFIPSSGYFFAINGVSWTLSCELLFYLSFPLLFPVLARLRLSRRRMLGIALILSIGAVDTLGNVIGGDVGNWFNSIFPLARIPEFILGILLAREIRDRTLPRVPLWSATVLALATYVGGSFLLSSWVNTSLPIVPFLLLIAAYAQADTAGRKTWASHRAVVWLGTVSFCFYLVHQLVIRGYTQFGDHAAWPSAGLAFVVCLGVSLLAAWVLHRVVELPANTWLRGRYHARPRRDGDLLVPASSGAVAR